MGYFLVNTKKCQNQHHKHKIQRPSKTSTRESYERCFFFAAEGEMESQNGKLKFIKLKGWNLSTEKTNKSISKSQPVL
jgi:hypothetical protein